MAAGKAMTDLYKNDISTPLPEMMNRDNTCCFTGHRHIRTDDVQELPSLLDFTIQCLLEDGYKYFVCGGAMGFDMLAEKAVIRSIKDGSGAELILALPCVNQTEKWRDIELIRDYRMIKGYATAIEYISDVHTDDCMKKRNQYMVDISSFCVAYYNGAVASGSGQTYRMAQRAGLDVLNLHSTIHD